MPLAGVDSHRGMLPTVRVWVCYSAASIYPFDDLIEWRAPLPEPLLRYAWDRHQAPVAVSKQIDEVKAVVHSGV
jgi:hypothetical protein